MTTPSAVSSDAIEKARAQFPATGTTTYLDTAARGLIPASAKIAADRQLDHDLAGRADKASHFDLIERVRAAYAALIGASPDEIAYIKNVSEGINLIANAVTWRAGDNVVLCTELEHPANIYPWFNLKRRAGIEIKSAPADGNAISADSLIAAIDSKTRIVSCSYVTFAPGLRVDIARLADACATRGVLLLVDAAQGVGIFDLDMGRIPVSAMAVATQKGLMGLYSTGFLYIRRSWAERLDPPFLSRTGVDLGAAPESAWGSEDFALMHGARRFDLGNYNYLGAAAVEPGLQLISALTIRAIEKHVLGLNDRLIVGLRQLGLPVIAAKSGQQSHIVAVGDALGSAHDTTDNPEVRSLHKALGDNGIRTSIRRGVMRVSTHLYNNTDDIDRVIGITGTWRRRTA
jgi:cysteine desulfurase/selenocysteine lyase